MAAGQYSLTVNGVSGALGASTSIALTITATGGGTLPCGVSVTPSAGSGAVGVAQNLQFVWASPAGQPGIGSSSIIIQDSALAAPGSANSCYLSVRTTGATTPADDTGLNFSSNSWVGYGYAASPSNSQCQLNAPASSFVAVTNGGSSEQVTLNLVFKAAWAGKTLAIWLQSQNTNYKSGAWLQLGAFAVQ